MDQFFSGIKLYGDDFSLDEIQAWFEDEKEGYADLGAKNKTQYSYAYHELNKIFGFECIKNIRDAEVLGLGSAYGDELLPVLPQSKAITILEPSDSFQNAQIHGVPCHYVKPNMNGDMPFEDNKFNIITSFGVLHHIPNVSHVISEIARCLDKGGYALIREPITSMGDWRNKRRGLTMRERGIPVKLFDEMIEKSGMEITRKTLCMFPPLSILAKKFGITPYNSRFIVYLDKLLSRVFYWNYRYHAEKGYQKFRPTSVFYLLRKK